jgi:protein-tyrosine-phosphatase
MAEALLWARLARDEARKDWRVGSAGVWTSDGRQASAHAIEEMAQRGIDLRAHRSRNVTRDLMAGVDLVLAMTRQHVEALNVAFPDHVDKVALLSEMVGQIYDILDPYGGTRLEYKYTARELEQLVEDGYDQIVARVEEAATR